MKEFEGQGVRADVSFGTAGETILQQGFQQTIAEPRHARPTICVSLTMRSEIEAISPLVDQLMPLVRAGHCVSGDDCDVEVALREALANAVLRANKRDTRKKFHVSCRIRPGTELSIVIRDEGNGFESLMWKDAFPGWQSSHRLPPAPSKAKGLTNFSRRIYDNGATHST